jgi:hypothetical protein
MLLSSAECQGVLRYELACCSQDDAADAKWFPVGQLPPLAFDHKEVVRTVFEKLSQRQAVRTEGGLCRVTLDFRSMEQMHHGGRAFKSELCLTGCCSCRRLGQGAGDGHSAAARALGAAKGVRGDAAFGSIERQCMLALRQH